MLNHIWNQYIYYYIIIKPFKHKKKRKKRNVIIHNSQFTTYNMKSQEALYTTSGFPEKCRANVFEEFLFLMKLHGKAFCEKTKMTKNTWRKMSKKQNKHKTKFYL